MKLAPFVTSIERLSVKNRNFRRVLYTPHHLQLVIMSLRPGEEIGLERHRVDQFFRIEEGRAAFIIEGKQYLAGPGDAVVVPAGSRHNVINRSRDRDLKMYTIYAPPQHPAGTIARTKAAAELVRDRKVRRR